LLLEYGTESDDDPLPPPPLPLIAFCPAERWRLVSVAEIVVLVVVLAEKVGVDLEIISEVRCGEVPSTEALAAVATGMAVAGEVPIMLGKELVAVGAWGGCGERVV